MSQISQNDDHSIRSDGRITLGATADYVAVTAGSTSEGLELLRSQKSDPALTGCTVQDVTSANYNVGFEVTRPIRVVVLIVGQDELHTELLSVDRLLDVEEQVTLLGLLRLTGLSGVRDSPESVHGCLERETLVRVPDELSEVERAVGERRAGKPHFARGMSA